MPKQPIVDLLTSPSPGVDLEQYSIGELEELIGESENRGRDQTVTKLLDDVRRILARRYRDFAKQASTEKVPRIDGQKIGLMKLPALPPHSVSIGDVNLLMTTVPVAVQPYTDVVIGIAEEIILRTGGLMPIMTLEYVVEGDNQAPRLCAQWHVPGTVPTESLHSLLQLAQAAYEQKVSGYKDDGVGWKVVGSHVGINNKVTNSARQGIYLGPQSYYNSASSGLFVSRLFRSKAEADLIRQRHPIDWLCKPTTTKKNQLSVELREAGVRPMASGPALAQDDFIMLVVQISFLLQRCALIEAAPLWVAIYRELNKVGTKILDRDSLYGTRQTLETLERVMLLPYQKPKLAAQLRIVGESALLVGVPGVGKTLLAHYLMAGEEYNAIFVAVDSDALTIDLAKGRNAGPSSILMRVDRIRSRTTLPVILIIDDIDVILQGQEIVSKFLNMMQGIRQKGLLVLASTNHPSRIDQRLLEPGRLSKILHVRLPTVDERFGILLAYLQHLPFASVEERTYVAKTLAKRTEHWSHRFLWELSQEASRYCIMEMNEGEPVLTMDHFDLAEPALRARLTQADLEGWDAQIAKLVEDRQRVGF